MSHPWYLHLVWILAAGVAGFMVTAVGSLRLRLAREWLLVPYTLVVAGLCVGYVRWSGLDLGGLLRQNGVWAAIGTVVLSLILIRNILAQPASARRKGLALAFELAWSGAVYGLADGLLLSALPVLATWQAGAALDWTVTWPGKVLVGALGLVASMFVTAAYHYGYAEFRGPRMKTALFGNSVMSLAYLLTTNPLTAVLSHAIMHMAAVLRGPATTVQLPPHYS
jgi:hypothetical protein